MIREFRVYVMTLGSAGVWKWMTKPNLTLTPSLTLTLNSVFRICRKRVRELGDGTTTA